MVRIRVVNKLYKSNKHSHCLGELLSINANIPNKSLPAVPEFIKGFPHVSRLTDTVSNEPRKLIARHSMYNQCGYPSHLQQYKSESLAEIELPTDFIILAVHP